MSYEINRPGDNTGGKARLSSFGKRVVVVLFIVAIVACLLVYSRGQANRRENELRDGVLAAIDRSEVVCQNALSAVGAGDQATTTLRGFSDRIEGAKQLADKVTAAQEMITYTLSHIGGNQAQTDELNGARNRILLAVQEYSKPR